MVEGDLRVEIGRIISPLYLNIFPSFNYILVNLVNKRGHNKSVFLQNLLIFMVILSPGRPSWASSWRPFGIS